MAARASGLASAPEPERAVSTSQAGDPADLAAPAGVRAQPPAQAVAADNDPGSIGSVRPLDNNGVEMDMAPLMARGWQAGEKAGVPPDRLKAMMATLWEAMRRLMEAIAKLLGKIFNAPRGVHLTDQQLQGKEPVKVDVQDDPDVPAAERAPVSNAQALSLMAQGANGMSKAMCGQFDGPSLGESANEEAFVVHNDRDGPALDAGLSLAAPTGLVNLGSLDGDAAQQEQYFHQLLSRQAQDLFAAQGQVHRRREEMEALVTRMAVAHNVSEAVVQEQLQSAPGQAMYDRDGSYQAAMRAMHQAIADKALVRQAMRALVMMPQAVALRDSGASSILQQWDELLKTQLDDIVEIPHMDAPEQAANDGDAPHMHHAAQQAQASGLDDSDASALSARDRRADQPGEPGGQVQTDEAGPADADAWLHHQDPEREREREVMRRG